MIDAQPWTICPECKCGPGDNHAKHCSIGKGRFVAAGPPQHSSGGMAKPTTGAAVCEPLAGECHACGIPCTAEEALAINRERRLPQARCPRCSTDFSQVARDKERERLANGQG